MMKSPLRKYILLLLAGVAAWGLNTALLLGRLPIGAHQLYKVLLLAWLLLALGMRVLGAWKERTATSFLLIGGFLAGLVFIFFFPYNFSPHDLEKYMADYIPGDRPYGHLGYIAYIVQYGKLPAMDPMVSEYSVFYNPPLFYLMEAGFMKLNLLSGIPEWIALENLQVLTLVCASACSLAVVDLMRFLKIKETGVRAGTLLMAFQPALWHLGATLNNDILSILCILLTVLFTVRWESTRRMGDILGAALFLGLGMAAKLSAALLIPCMAVVFAVAFFRDLKRWKAYIPQFGAFLGVSVPVAMAWPLYHRFAFGMPFSYVRTPDEMLNVSAIPLWQRFGLPGWYAIRQPFCTGDVAIDHNLWMQTLKTAVFDELPMYARGTLHWNLSFAALSLFALLLLVSLVLFVRFLLRHRTAAPMARAFLGGYAAVLLGNYLKFYVDFPYTCTASFRYIVPVLAMAALGVAAYRAECRRSRWITALCALFALLAAAVYAILIFLY